MTATTLRQPLLRMGGSDSPGLPIVVFAHANGYPPQAYRSLLQALEGICEIWAIEHRPFWIGETAPVRLSWQTYATDLLVTIAENFSRPVWLVGHSMGAVSSFLAASRAPERVAGVVAFDPVLLRDRLWWPAQLMGRLNPNGLPIVARALSRPHEFQSVDAAFRFYRGKRVFQRVSDVVLWDYVHAAHAPVAGHGVRLRWSGAWEACVYRSAPRAWGALRRIELPTLGLIGVASDVIDSGAVSKWQRTQPHASLETLEGGHLLPLEYPEICADLASQFIATHSRDRP